MASCTSLVPRNGRPQLLGRVRHIASGLMGLHMADKIEGDDKSPSFGSFRGREEGGGRVRDRTECRVTRVITVAARPLRAARSLHTGTKCILTRIYLRAEYGAPGCTAGAAEDSKTITSAKGSEPIRSVSIAK